MSDTPAWLRKLERRFRWVAIPNISVLLITLQVLGYVCVNLVDPVWAERLALVPGRVLEGEVWRLVTWLALPLQVSPIWLLFGLWFLYFILDSIEGQWGAFKTTLYVLTSMLVTTVFSFVTGAWILQAVDFQSTLFFAAAALFPEVEIRLFMILPVKMKWLAAISGAFVVWRFAQGSWVDRVYLLAIYSNFILFFSGAVIDRARLWNRRRSFRSKMRRD